MSVLQMIFYPGKLKSGRVISNPHLWVMLALTAVLTLFYYEAQIFGARIVPFFWNIEVFEFTYNATGSLFCLLFIYAALIFWWRGALIAWWVSLIILLPRITTIKPDPLSITTNIVYLLIPLILVIYFAIELNWRNKARKEMADREAERQKYVAQVFKAAEDERKRLAQEIHDDSIQRLAVIASSADLLSHDRELTELDNIRNKVINLRDLIISVNQDLRRFSLNLHPIALDDLGLVPALRWLADVFQQERKIKVGIEVTGYQEVNKKMAINIYRIVQEALNNIDHHAQASQVLIKMQMSAKNIKLEISDNGRGFILPPNSQLTTMGKLGLIGMQQRAQIINGALSIQSKIGVGTTIALEVTL